MNPIMFRSRVPLYISIRITQAQHYPVECHCWTNLSPLNDVTISRGNDWLDIGLSLKFPGFSVPQGIESSAHLKIIDLYVMSII